MTRIFTDGAEMGDVLFWNYASNVSATTLTKRTGTYAYMIAGEGQKYAPSTSEGYLRVGYNFYGGVNQSDSGQIGYYSGGTQLLTLNLGYNTGYKHVAKRSGTLLATGSFVHSNNTWYVMEIYVKIHDTEGRFVVKVNDLLDIDYTGDTQPGADTTFNNIRFWTVCANQGTAFDDLAFNDTNNSDGKNDNSWCKGGYILKLIPSGSGIHNNWANSGSVSGSANYLYVDEYPADTSTFIYASASSSGSQAQFRLSQFTIPGARITRIFPEIRAKRLSSNEYGIKIGELALGGTDVVSGSIIPQYSETSFTRIIGNEVKINPVTSASWTAGDLNNLELIMEMG